MDLKDFVVGAISDISNGVSEADKAIQEIGGMVNPGVHQKAAAGGRIDFVAPRTTLNFDIAVTATDKGGAEGSVKGRIWVVEASIEGQAASSNEQVSRLTFSIDVVLPYDENQKQRIGLVQRQA